MERSSRPLPSYIVPGAVKETSLQQFVCISMEGDNLIFHLSCASVSLFGHITWLGTGFSCGGVDRKGVDVSSVALSLHDSEHKLTK